MDSFSVDPVLDPSLVDVVNRLRELMLSKRFSQEILSEDEISEDSFLTDKENDKKRKRADPYEEDVYSDYANDDEIESMMEYYKSILTDEMNDEETNTQEERENLVKTVQTYYDTTSFFLPPPVVKRRKNN